ncbi:hypothetical protein C9374_008256 [Naegleria lovaniensis]|uniref:Guanylate-binding protein N-terminal domain-containing protein n=1 Tax=Naegleria lovaniensis TaxID=51637 RepID=A0AA88GJP3_NAELO|nr:uncharacterized protein C9374_008256 [Naegleria lovaniensis]KAG2378617.1 hypothetical protein C9374_008256 [Naegleria lovaniensis]
MLSSPSPAATSTTNNYHSLFSQKGLPISSSPFLLFHYNFKSRKWEMNEQAKSILSLYSNGSTQLYVISLVDAFRLGKSDLMNQLLLHKSTEKQERFEFGMSILSRSKGVWAWGERSCQDERQILLVLDTEGYLDAVDREEEDDNDQEDDFTLKYDKKLFCLMTLLASSLIVNFSNQISSDHDLRQISFTANFSEILLTEKRKEPWLLKQRFSKKNRTGTHQDDLKEDYEDEIVRYTPHLMWLISDMTLPSNVSEEDYLNNVLAENTKSKKNREKEMNKIKSSIKKFFKNKMELLTVPPPFDDLESMKHNNTSEVNSHVGDKMEFVVNKIRSNVAPKKILSPVQNTELFLSPILFYYYCSKLLDELNENGDNIDLSNAFDHVMKQQVEVFLVNSEKHYDQRMNELCEKKFPMEEFELLNKHVKVFTEINRLMREQIPSCKQQEVLLRMFTKLGYVSSSSQPSQDESKKDDSSPPKNSMNYDSPYLKNSKLETLLIRNKESSHELCNKIFEQCLSQLRREITTCESMEIFMEHSKQVQHQLIHSCIGPSRLKFLQIFSKHVIELREFMDQQLKMKDMERHIHELRELTTKLEQEKASQYEAFQHEKQLLLESMNQLQQQQLLLKDQLEKERLEHSQELQKLRNELNSKNQSTALSSSSILISTPSASTTSTTRIQNNYCRDYESDEDDCYNSSSRRSSSSSSRSGKKFYKGGQFLPGGGRAPKGGIWM